MHDMTLGLGEPFFAKKPFNGKYNISCLIYIAIAFKQTFTTKVIACKSTSFILTECLKSKSE